MRVGRRVCTSVRIGARRHVLEKSVISVIDVTGGPTTRSGCGCTAVTEVAIGVVFCNKHIFVLRRAEGVVSDTEVKFKMPGNKKSKPIIKRLSRSISPCLNLSVVLCSVFFISSKIFKIQTKSFISVNGHWGDNHCDLIYVGFVCEQPVAS